MGGFRGPYQTGWISDLTGSYRIGLFSLAATLIAGSALALAVRTGRR